MAIYNYKCLACGHAFEVKATIQEKESEAGEKFICPKCGSKDMKQEFSLTNFVKNIFSSGEESGNCCSGGDCCGDDTVKKEEKNSSCCGGDDSEADCCSRK